MPFFRKKTDSESIDLHREMEDFEVFLKNDYMASEYLVPTQLDATLRRTADNLAHLDGFVGLVNVGGTANGSYMWRCHNQAHPATDVDVYLVGNSHLDLGRASRMISKEVSTMGLTLDGELNGRNAANYLNMDDLDGIINGGDAALLALVFQSFYGSKQREAQAKVLKTIMARPDAQEVWDEIASFHAQSLSLHHGTFTDAQNELIMTQYYPQKVEKYELPLSPEDMVVRH